MKKLDKSEIFIVPEKHKNHTHAVGNDSVMAQILI